MNTCVCVCVCIELRKMKEILTSQIRDIICKVLHLIILFQYSRKHEQFWSLQTLSHSDFYTILKIHSESEMKYT